MARNDRSRCAKYAEHPLAEEAAWLEAGGEQPKGLYFTEGDAVSDAMLLNI